MITHHVPSARLLFAGYLRQQRAAGPNPASNIPNQIRYLHLERIRKGFQGPKGHVAFSALQFPDMSAVQAAHIPENVL
jgi:hypothetical protein